jgi:lipid A 3-O-deacylase
MPKSIVRALVYPRSMYLSPRALSGSMMQVRSQRCRSRGGRPLAKRVRCRLVALAAVAGAFLPAAAARAQGVPPFIDEVKLGILDHGVGGPEHGVDINPDILFVSPVTEAMLSFIQLPEPLQWFVIPLLRPRPDIGGEINTAGQTSTFYVGGNWTWQFVHNVFQPGDGFSGSVVFGPSVNNGVIVSRNVTRESLGANVLFHVGGELNYEITSHYEISFFFDHESNAGLARYNVGNNDAGVRFGYKF